MASMALPPGWFDISPPVSPTSAVFPGDTAYHSEALLSFATGANLALTTLHTTPHVGAHADAPCHYDERGVGIDQRSLTRYLGTAQVVTVTTAAGDRVQVADLPVAVTAPRLLIRTSSFADPDCWHDEFCSLSVALIESLADLGVVLVGIDTPSVDPAPAKILTAHHAIYRRDMAILEGLDLRGVADGLYTLIALPLRLVDADASPVRALLVPALPELETTALVAARVDK